MTGIQNGLFSRPRIAILIGFGEAFATGFTVPSSDGAATLSKAGPGGSFFDFLGSTAAQALAANGKARRE